MRVHVVLEVAPEHVPRLVAAAPGATFGGPVPDGVDVLVHGYPTDAELAAVRRGGALVIPFAGVPPAVLGRLADRADLAVYNLHHGAEIVVEHAIGLVLAVSRRILPMDARLRAGDWRPRVAPDPAIGLAGHRALVLGYGAIGRGVAAALRALGMRVDAVRRRGGDDAHPAEALDDLLPGSRVVVVAVPHTPATDGLLDARRIGLLGPETVVVNVARGPVVDEVALFEALRDGRLYGAGIDVWWRMPAADALGATPASVLPFDALDNVVLSPHRAAHAADTEDRRTAALARLLADLVGGREPPSRVDVAAGY